MFWKFNVISTSSIETLLMKENITLQELMNEEDILQECKAQNKSLVDFLIRPMIMSEMVNLVIAEPQDEQDEKIKYKFSNIASELLTSDVPQITEALANEKNLLTKLYSFLETEKPLNPLLASFFSKTLGILISRKTETIFEFFQSKDFVNQVIDHLKTSAIMDLLLRLVTCPENSALRNDILNWLNVQQTIPRLLSLIDPTFDEERHCNASLAICDIIRMARDRIAQATDSPEPDPLLLTIESADSITLLLNHMFSAGKSESVLTNGILVLLTLLEVKKPGFKSQQQQQPEQPSIYFRPEAQETMTPQDEERIRQGLSRTVTAILSRIKDFHQLLIEPPKKLPISTTIGILDPPLGGTRIQVATLVSALIVANVHAVNMELVNLGTMDVLLDLFFQYSWNNFLHTQVEQCIGMILQNSPTENEEGKQVHPLLEHLFTKCRLITRILDAWEDNEKEEAKPGGHRRGYMGHLTNIANHITHNLENGSNSALLNEKIKELAEDVRPRWDTFVSGVLTDINKKNFVVPLNTEDELEANAYPHETSLQQAFGDYQIQQMTNNFIDQFGFEDDEFGEHEENVNTPLERLSSVGFGMSAEEDARRALFEQACNERIQPLDDADSDEDIWEKEQIISKIIEARPGMGGSLASRISRVGSDQSTDSDEDDPKPVPLTSSTPAPNADEMKMDVDQGDAGWATGFEAIPMDTGNPWDNPVAQGEGTSGGAASTQGTADWADFGAFSKFGSAASFSTVSDRQSPAPHLTHSTNAPIAMETSEESNFKLGLFAAVTQGAIPVCTESSGSAQINPRSHERFSCGGGEKDIEQLQSHPGCSENNASSVISDIKTLDSATESTLFGSPPVMHELVDKLSDEPVTHDEISAGGHDLSQNFNYLLTSGLMKPSSPEAVAEVSADCAGENGPTNDADTSTTRPVLPVDQSKLEEARAKAREALDNFASEVGPTPNGPL